VPDMPRILVVDDEPQIHRFLERALEAAGYTPLRADTGKAGLEALATRPPDAMLLDLGLPDMDGAAVLARARLFFSRPIIVISARGDVAARIKMLDLGADDYLQKPFDIAELLARLRAATRNRAEPSGAQPVIAFGDNEIDLTQGRVTRLGDEVHLTTHEYNLLSELVRAPGRVLTHSQLLLAVWGPNDTENVQYLRVFVQRLRKKLETDPARPRHILTETGVGYRFRP